MMNRYKVQIYIPSLTITDSLTISHHRTDTCLLVSCDLKPTVADLCFLLSFIEDIYVIKVSV